MIRIPYIIVKLNTEIVTLLKKIRKHNNGNKQLPELIKSYQELGNKAEEHITSLQSEKSGYRISFPETYLMDKAG